MFRIRCERAYYDQGDSQCGIITGIGVSAILGWFLILSLFFSIQDYGTTVASPTGQPVTQIFLDTVGKKGAIVLMVSKVS
jgi:hypothetical protein